MKSIQRRFILPGLRANRQTKSVGNTSNSSRLLPIDHCFWRRTIRWSGRHHSLAQRNSLTITRERGAGAGTGAGTHSAKPSQSCSSAACFPELFLPHTLIESSSILPLVFLFAQAILAGTLLVLAHRPQVSPDWRKLR